MKNIKLKSIFILTLLYTFIQINPMYSQIPHSDLGYFNYDFSSQHSFEWQAITPETTAQIEDNVYVVKTARQTSGQYAGSIAKKGSILLNAGKYPIIAIKLKKPERSNLTLNTNLGTFNNSINNASKIELVGENTLYYWDLSKGTLGNTQLSKTTTTEISFLQIDVTDILADKEHTNYEVYWIKTFSSLNELKADIGLLDDDFSLGNALNWEVSTTGATGKVENGEFTIMPVLETNGLYRADFSKSEKITLNIRNFPIVAIMMNKPTKSSLALDSNLGPYNNWRNNASIIQLPDGNTIYYWDLSKGTLGNTILSPNEPVNIGVLRFKITDIEFSENELKEFPIYWVRTYASTYDLMADNGYINDDFSIGKTYGWDTSTEHAEQAQAEMKNGKLIIHPTKLLNGNYRGDIKKAGNVKIHPGNYPIIAIKFHKPCQCSIIFDTNLGPYNGGSNNAKEIDLGDNNYIYYWDLSKGTLGNTKLQKNTTIGLSTFQFKILDIVFNKGEKHEYEVEWIRSFSSVDAMYKELNMPKGSSISIIIWGVLIFFMGSTGIGLVYWKHRKKHKPSSLIPPPLRKEKNNGQEKLGLIFTDVRRKEAALNLLGATCFWNNNNEDIAPQFSPTVKQLFLLIFLYSIKFEKGISSTQIDELLWPDKTFENARNNRNVNISKLKSLLVNMGNIELEKNENYWRLKLNDVYSDYIEVLSIIHATKNKEIAHDKNSILHFLRILNCGQLVPSYQIDWLDEFKAEFTNSVMDILEYFTTLSFIAEDNNYLYEIAECMLKYDNLNDMAIYFKCFILYQEGKKNLSKKAYDTFCKEYKESLNTNYPLSFEEIIRKQK